MQARVPALRAQPLHRAQPPLSQQIKQLEEEPGTQLLVRTTRKVGLTPAGQLLPERSRTLLGDLKALEQDVRQVSLGASGVLRVDFAGRPDSAPTWSRRFLDEQL